MRALTVICLLLATTQTAAGQQPPASPQGVISGEVRDQSGVPLPGVEVTLSHPRLGIRVAVSDPSGRFVFPDVVAEQYEIVAQAAGFQRVGQTIAPKGGVFAPVLLVFRTGSVLESVEVSAGPPPRPDVPIRWNAWVEAEAGAPFAPVTHMQPGRRYRLTLDVAALSYSRHRRHVYSREVSNHLDRVLDEWLDDHPDSKVAPLRILVVPDPRYFEPLADTEEPKRLEIDLEKLRDIRDRNADIDDETDPFAQLRTDPSPDFMLGRVSFVVETTRGQKGRASFAISIWGEGFRPLDEVALGFCVAAGDSVPRQCDDGPIVSETLQGIDAARVALSEDGTEPDAALHFLRFEAGRIVGVFRRNDGGRDGYVTWPLGLTASELSGRIADVISDIGGARSARDLEAPGNALYDLFFPRREEAAREAFEEFLRAAAALRPSGSETWLPPSLFVRMVPAALPGGAFVPMGLMRVRGLGSFVGQSVRVESPLPLQDYSAASTCLEQWAVAFPPANTSDFSLKLARDRLAAQAAWWRRSPVFTESTDAFGEWATEDAEDPPTLLTVLSHHSRDRIQFGGRPFYPESFAREFENGAVILAACGTASTSPVSLVSRLNRNGMTAAIVTNAVIDSKLAGDFLKAISNVLETSAMKGMLLSDLFFRAVQAVRSDTADGDSTYGDLALTFSLLGNGNLRVCAPPPAPPK